MKRHFEIIIQCLIILSVITFSIGTLPNLETKYINALKHIDFFIIIIFTIEYGITLKHSRNKLKRIFSFSGIIDLIVIVTFYLTIGLDLRVMRIFRLFRLAKLYKIKSATNALNHFNKAFECIKGELKIFGISMIFILYISATGIYYFENQVQPDAFSSIFHSLWWSVTTLTTVGYGDMYPITVGGKFFTFIILLLGLGIVAVPTGLISTALSKTVKKE